MIPGHAVPRALALLAAPPILWFLAQSRVLRTSETAVAPFAQTCLPAIRDQAAPDSCLEASTIPTLGTLYPLGLEFNIDPSGRVGIGTTAPMETLSVAGLVHSETGGFRFPDGSVQEAAYEPATPVAAGSFVTRRRATLEVFPTVFGKSEGSCFQSYTRNGEEAWAASGSATFHSVIDEVDGLWERIRTVDDINSASRSCFRFALFQSLPRFYARVKLDPDPVDVTTELVVGLARGFNFGFEEGAYFRYDGPGNDNNFWHCVTNDSAGDQVTQTAEALVADSIYELEVHTSPTEVHFFINGNLVATHTSVVPSGDLEASGIVGITRPGAGADGEIYLQRAVIDFALNPLDTGL